MDRVGGWRRSRPASGAGWRPIRSGAPGAAPDTPDDWGQLVGSLLYERRDAVVFIDPLVPPDADEFWGWADERVVGRRAVVLTTLAPHRRDRERVARRYGASTSRAKRNLPDGVEAIVLRGAGETMFWLPEHRALIPGDRILGAPGGELRMCPESWLYWVSVDREGLRALLEPLLELDIERVLVSHGEPVLSGGAAALRRCLSGS